MADNLDREVLTRVKKTSDIEIHTSLLDSPQGKFVEIREYVVSLDQYGRGLTFPVELASVVAEGVTAADLAGSTS